ncbi:fimbrial protein [Paraburkholderia xenovorans]|uniref:fimbrial protein n=1 Tax=Paraburkholderia xenovorans TaxID=36873 RepID=UPI0015595BB3|nr:fimbrial protein [Paraburkholderia xenovorans]
MGNDTQRSDLLSLMRLFVRVAFSSCIGMLSLSAHAALNCTTAGANNVINAGSISVPANPTVGATIATLAPTHLQMLCKMDSSAPVETTATLGAYFYAESAHPVAGFTDVFPTNVQSVGIRYRFNAPACNASNVPMYDWDVLLTCPVSGEVGGPYVPIDVTVITSLVVTANGPIPLGVRELTTVPLVAIAFETSDSPEWSWPQSPLYTGAASGRIVHACAINQPDASVTLPTVNSSAFSDGVGSVAGPQLFSLVFSCGSGAQVSIVLTDNTDPSNRSNVLTPTADSTAKGIGIQILNDSGAPVSFGPDSSEPFTINQWVIGRSPNGRLEVPLTARYIRTGNVVAGAIRALATFTMSYQ